MKVTIYTLSDGTFDVHVEENGITNSFDPAQLPKEMQDAMGKVAAAALDTVEKEKAARIAAEERFAFVDGETLEALKADNQAKDANIQVLLEQVSL